MLQGTRGGVRRRVRLHLPREAGSCIRYFGYGVFSPWNLRTSMTTLPHHSALFPSCEQNTASYLNAMLARQPGRLGTMALDLGCGTDGLAFALFAAPQDLQITSVDNSVVDIATADARCAARGHWQTVEFVEDDFHSGKGGRFQAIIADVASDGELFADKLGAQLHVGGT